MTQKELADFLGISQGYLSRIYNGMCRPGWKLADRWKSVTKKSFEWWKSAKQSDIQKLLNRIGNSAA